LSLDADVRRLSAVRPFAALPREALQLLAFSCEKRSLKAGETLFRADDPADCAFFVLDGEIELARGEVTKAVRTGSLIGETALTTETLRPADARAVRDSLLLRVPAHTFRRVLAEFPQGAAEIRRAAAGRTGALLARLEAIRRRAFATGPARG
jgi:CRP-like cAMP-binding protein